MKDSPNSAGKAASTALAAGAASVASVAAAAAPGRVVPAKLVAMFAKIPTDDDAVTQQIMQSLLDAETISKLVELVGPDFGDPQGVKPKYALHGLVHYASRPGAAADRKLVAQALAKELSKDHSDELQAFICRQLQLCGGGEEVPALAPLLESERLCEPATQALTAIGDQNATAALRKALPVATGKRRTTLINALGRLQDKDSASEVRKSVNAEDRDQRLVTWYALASIGDASAADALLKAAEIKVPYERSQATDACLRLARRLGETGDQTTAEKVCRALMSKRTSADDVHDRCAALATLAAALGTKSVGDLMAALDSKEVAYRHPAARTAVDLACAIRDDKPAEADKLLKKVVEATQEEAVRQQAEMLLEDAEA